MDISTTATTKIQPGTPLSNSANASGTSEQAASANISTAPVQETDLRPILNPASHIDPSLGIVVVETYNKSGDVTEQYPTAHMLQQYSLYGMASKRV